MRRHGRPTNVPAPRPVEGTRDLLARILDTPQLAQVVPRLQPDILHRLIERCGLEDCGEIVALTTPGQLAGVFDLDLWRSGRPGLDEQFDAGRFGVWLEVLLESGAGVAAQKLADMDAGFVIAALAQHLVVVDPASLSPSAASDDDRDPPPMRIMEDDIAREIAGYLVVPRRRESWDAIAEVLLALDAEHGAFFHRVMHGCRRLSNSTPEVDGLDDLLGEPDQVMFDLAVERERRREVQGFVDPAQARAFLQASRQLDLREAVAPSGSPIALAGFRGMAQDAGEVARGEAGRPAAAGETLTPDEAADESASALAGVIDTLREAGILQPPPRALLGASSDRPLRLVHIQTHLQFTYDRDVATHSARNQELAYLANAILAACSVQSRPFTADEASEAAVAVCNLGLQNWPANWVPMEGRSSAAGTGTALPDDFLMSHSLVSVFQAGWTVLHEEVCLYSAERLVNLLGTVRCEDRELRIALDALRLELSAQLRKGTPWRAEAYLDVIATLDAPAWAGLLGLINECPVMHAAVAAHGTRALSVSPSAFEFISENGQIARIGEFIESLRERLIG